MHTREADHFAQLDPVVITAMAKVSGRTLKLTKFCQWMRAKLHLASVFQGNRKSANIHASPGVIRGIPVQVVYWPAYHRAARVEDPCHQKRGGLKII